MKIAICNHQFSGGPWLASVGMHLLLMTLVLPGVKWSSPHKASIVAELIVVDRKPEPVLVPKRIVEPSTLGLKGKPKARARLGAVKKSSVSGEAEIPAPGGPASTHEAGRKGVTWRAEPLLVNGDQIQIPYPAYARHYRIEGKVRLRLTVAESGQVVNAEVLSGPAHGLRQAALRIARKLFFLPATDERGQARMAQVEHEVVFRLHGRS